MRSLKISVYTDKYIVSYALVLAFGSENAEAKSTLEFKHVSLSAWATKTKSSQKGRNASISIDRWLFQRRQKSIGASKIFEGKIEH